MGLTRILWTTSPAGTVTVGNEQRFAVSVHATLRMEDGSQVSDFPTVANWAAVEPTFRIHFRRNNTVWSTEQLVSDASVRRPSWWTAAVPGEVPVRRFDLDEIAERASWKVRSHPADLIAQWVAVRYLDAAQVATPVDGGPPSVDAPSITPIANVAGIFSRQSQTIVDPPKIQALEAQLTAQGFVEPSSDVRDGVLQLMRFYHRTTKPDPPDTGAAPSRPGREGRISWLEAPRLDAHQLIGSLGRHPALLRPLGLVHDLVADLSVDRITTVLGGAPELVWVTADIEFDANAEKVLAEPSPRTACVLDGDRFRAKASPEGDLDDNGWVRVDRSDFSIRTFDPDQAGHAFIAYGSDLQIGQTRRGRTTPTRLAPEPLRSAGLVLLRTGRAKQFRRQVLERAQQINAEIVAARPNDDGSASAVEPPRLFLDDLVRGYRVDVDDGGQWRSLMRRKGAILIGPGAEPITVEVGEDEAAVEFSPAGDDEPGQVYLPEEVVRWDGWSLAASKPGRAVGPEDQVGEFDGSEVPEDSPFRVEADYVVSPGSLPRFRYGASYALRARVVDLCGNGPGLADGARATPRRGAVGERWDPVPSPAVLQAEPRRPGEADDRVVLLSDRWDDVAEARSVRHLQPPRITIGEVERHGELDRSDGTPDPLRYAQLADLDDQGYQDLGTPDPSDGIDVPDEERTRFYGTDPLPVRGAPDPMARRLLVATIAGSPLLFDGDEPFLPRFQRGDWPDWSGIRLEIVEDPDTWQDAPSAVTKWIWDDAQRVVRVVLPKGMVEKIRIASVPEGDDFGRLAVYRQLEERGADPSLFGRIRLGRHWAISPSRTLTLVHAVKQPLLPPKHIFLGEVARIPGETTARLSGRVGISWRSTGSLDLFGSWDEGVDGGPGTPAPQVVSVTDVAYSADLGTDLPTPDPGEAPFDVLRHLGAHEFGDTKARRVTYAFEATTRFLEHFTERRTISFADPTFVDIRGLVPSTVVVRSVPDADGNVITYQRGDRAGEGDYRVEGGSIRRTRTTVVDGRPPLQLGQEIEITYVPPEVSRLTKEIAGAGGPVQRVIRSSARPLPPSIRQVLPTFRWTSSGSATVTSARQPAGIRVYLERPWWSSGLGEQLAVIVRPGGATPPQAVEKFVTRWGRDPIHSVGQVMASVDINQFPAALGQTAPLAVPGCPEELVALPHAVDYAPDRDLWFCDIDLSIGSSWPFVRLALARHQPAAISWEGQGSLALSPVVLADFVQLAPGRVATVSARGVRAGRRNRVILDVTVDGRSHVPTTSDPRVPVVRVTVERLDPTLGPDVGWQPRGKSVELTRLPNTNPNAEFRWSGAIGTERTSLPTRLVIEEFEVYRTDGSSAPDTIDGIPLRLTTLSTGRRLVHLDTIDVSHLVGPSIGG
jgi:hypothetical protein